MDNEDVREVVRSIRNKAIDDVVAEIESTMFLEALDVSMLHAIVRRLKDGYGEGGKGKD